MSENAVKQYEQNIKELKDIISNFQKGNMPLKQAVEKYNRSEELIKTCQTTLNTFEQTYNNAQQYEQLDNTDTFENNLSRLQEIIQIIDNTSDMPLQQLLSMMQESKKLIHFCQQDLNNFKHLIEHHTSN